MKIFNNIIGKWLLLSLALLATALSAQSQYVMVEGTIYKKLPVDRIITSGNAADRNKLSNGERDPFNQAWTSENSRSGPYSYINFDLQYPSKKKFLLRYDTYQDQAPTRIGFFGSMNPNAGANDWRPIADNVTLTNPGNTSHKEIIDLSQIPEVDMYRYIQMRVYETTTPDNRICKLAEMDLLVDGEWGGEYNLNDKLDSSNRGKDRLGNLYDNNDNNIWQINYELTGVVPGEYSNIKVDLGEPTSGYVYFNYSTREMQAPMEIAFYGYNGDDWNVKSDNLEDTPKNINTKWEPLNYVVDPTYTDSPNAPWSHTQLDNQMSAEIHTFGDNQNNQTHNVIIKIPEDTPYRYIMMRVYEGTGNPDDRNFNGHIGSIGAGNVGPDAAAEYIPTDMRDRSGKGYMFNFDLRTLAVYKESLIPNKEKLLKLEFVPTNGVVDRENKDVWGYGTTNISGPTWTDNGTWGEETFATIAERYKLNQPDFKRRGEKEQLQAAHEKEYTIYVIPGETVALIPYSDIAENPDLYYNDGYIRWYNYNSGEALPDENFGYAYNPVLAWQTPYGLFGSNTVINRLGTIAGNNPGLNGNGRYRAAFTQFHAPAGEDVQPFKVAADFTTGVYENWDAKTNNMMREGEDKVQIIEPPVTFRAVFNIKDGKEFARKLTTENKTYINENRKIVSAPSGKIFRIRLDFQEPEDTGVPSDIYYQTPDDGVDHVYKFKVVTDETDETMFYIENGFDDNNGIGEVRLPKMGFVGEQTGKNFRRFLGCKRENATPGKHVVKIYGLDKDGNVLQNSEKEPLQIMEYVITFEQSGVDVSMQSMSDYLLNLDEDKTNDKLLRHTSQNLRERFGAPYSKQDFDQYTGLEFSIPESDLDKYFTTKNITYGGKRFVTKMGRIAKYPVKWEDADYAYSYATAAGWNKYTITNHSEMTSYSVGAGTKNDRGLFDVSFYFNHPNLYKDEVQSEEISSNDPTFNYATHRYSDAGYFFYVDAAADPGRIYRSEIEKLCPGTRLHVSAWVSEFGNSDISELVDSTGNWANVIFHFRKQSSDGTIKTLYSYVPGKVPTYGDWYHIYFSFSPNMEDMTDDPDAKYYVVLESNCPSSWGADYAVDDIEIFIQKPEVNLMQEAPICITKDDKGVGQLRLLVECPYEVLVKASGLEETDNKAHLYFCTINKEKYDEEKGEEEDGKSYNETAFEKSIVQILTGPNTPSSFGRIGFDVDYDQLPHFNDFETSEKPDCVVMKYENDYDEKCIRFFMTIKDDPSLRIGSNLIFSLMANPTEKGDDMSPAELITLLKVDDACSIHTELRLQGASIIKVDGVVVDDKYDITACENQRPVVQLIMEKKDKDGKVEISKVKDQYYDWFDGTYEEFVGSGLEAALAAFRYHYPKAETYDMPVKNSDGEELDIVFSEKDKELLEAYCVEKKDTTDKKGGRLHLYKSSYIFPQYKLGKNQESLTVYVTAKPIEVIFDEESDEESHKDVMLCMNPVEIPLTIRNSAPVMLHGLGMAYPASMLDVPLRVGLRQIQGAQTDIQTEDLTGAKSLLLPVRQVSPVTGSVQTLVMAADRKAPYVRMPDQYIYLVQSNDPRYQSLTPTPNGGEDANESAPGNGKDEFDGLLEVGRIVKIKATRDEEGGYVPGRYIQAVFDKDFTPREGYYYTMRYSFIENQAEVNPSEYLDEDEAPCYGEDTFTIKIVPEYQVWTGAKSDDYNDDNNWRRVSADKLLANGNDNTLNVDGEISLDGLVIDEKTNSNIKSYVPMDFTKVIVPNAKKLDDQGYIAKDKDNEIDRTGTMEAGDGRTLRMNDVAQGNSYDISVVGENNTFEGKNTFSQSESGYAGDIKYDMAAYLDDNENVQCKHWYHNTCEQIHFNFGGEMLNQGLLNYEKAWLDLDNKPGKWYFLSLPLKETYAGDFYLPSADARQRTPLFTDIKFDKSTNDRFKPAVYQRGWNKSSATVFDLEGGERNAAAVTAKWSRVYNDVTEKYSFNRALDENDAKADANPGFSIKTVVDFMDSKPVGDDPTVRFRFPKADDAYDYYSFDGNTSGNTTPITRSAAYRLNESTGTMTARVAEASKYFLVGNPFICHLDIDQFVKQNKGKIEDRIWILNNGEFKAVSSEMYKDEKDEEGNENVWRYLPPFQGFFVEALTDKGKELTLNYNADMMHAVMGDDLLSLNDRPTAKTESTVVVTSSAKGNADSEMRIVVGNGEGNDVAAIFNADSESGMTVYGKAGNLASSVRYVDAIRSEEVGVVVRGDEEVTLRFNGEALDGLRLLDKLTGAQTDLYDGMEYKVNGSVADRLFIVGSTTGVDEVADEDFQLEINGTSVVLIAPSTTSNLLMQVYDMEGRVVTNVISDTNRAEASLSKGVYVVTGATDEGSKYSSKIIVK